MGEGLGGLEVVDDWETIIKNIDLQRFGRNRETEGVRKPLS